MYILSRYVPSAIRLLNRTLKKTIVKQIVVQWISLSNNCLDVGCLSAVLHIKSVQPMIGLSTQKSVMYYSELCGITHMHLFLIETFGWPAWGHGLLPLCKCSLRLLHNITLKWSPVSIHVLNKCCPDGNMQFKRRSPLGCHCKFFKCVFSVQYAIKFMENYWNCLKYLC